MSLDSIDMPLFQSGETWTGEGFLYGGRSYKGESVWICQSGTSGWGLLAGQLVGFRGAHGISMGVLSSGITITLPNQSVGPNLGTNPPDTPYPWEGESCPDWKSRDLEVAPTKEKVVWICQSGSSSEGDADGGTCGCVSCCSTHPTSCAMRRIFYLNLHHTYDTILALGMEGIAIIISVKF